jgi:hypothetical protein
LVEVVSHVKLPVPLSQVCDAPSPENIPAKKAIRNKLNAVMIEGALDGWECGFICFLNQVLGFWDGLILPS